MPPIPFMIITIVGFPSKQNSATNDLKLAECFSCDLNRQSTRMDQRSLQALVRTTQLLRTAQLRILTESNLRWSDNFALQRIGEAGDVDRLKTTCDKIKPWAVRSKRIACARLCYSIGSKETQTYIQRTGRSSSNPVTIHTPFTPLQ